ncbi:hypothetical protein PP914_gp176 [Arthrobacter phage Qui]|jgi:hypothetical protein|uniref:Uncharacterized protein n=1 Tax=Arthrobacter phage Qui TaxID=2603260 RepID=A0A5B8WG22_9CAUD|nr:hypothetical protein PP914_gp176 [Arthrobacter phage Qui]QED11664.1 hypothetical protein SEA_QUI_176 [Arthrobacter phage Qui]QOC56495.1 hypothetical protein SEA_PAELLA_176 [Arthrobacter phage Paella]
MTEQNEAYDKGDELIALVTDENLAKLLNPSWVPGITLDYIRTAQQCDFKWEFHKGIKPTYHEKPGAHSMIHECREILGEPHTHTCIDCHLDIDGIDVDGVYES